MSYGENYPCEHCDVGWGTISSSGLTSCKDVCEKYKKYKKANPMKIYQLHELFGEYEDFEDNIIGTYAKMERAEEERQKAIAREKEDMKHSDKCWHCPVYNFENLHRDIETVKGTFGFYCDKVQNIDESGNCKNYYIKHETSLFQIAEVIVEE